MPLLNSMGSLRNMGLNSSSASSNQHYMYMFAPGGVNSNYLSQNDRTIGNYDSSQGKYVAVDAYGDQIISFTDSSSIVFDGSQSFIYTPWMAAANNNCYYYNPSNMRIVNLASYTYTNINGTIPTGSNARTIVDSTGAIIFVTAITVSSVNYISISKFTTSGITWQQKISQPTGLTTTNFVVTDVCLDSSDNIYFSGQLGANGVWGRVTSAGAPSYVKYQGSIHVAGLAVVGTTLYAAMMSTNTGYENYDWRPNLSTALPYVAAITASSGTMTKLTWIEFMGGSNQYALTGISADPSDPSSIFVYGYSRDMSSSIPGSKVFVFKFNSALTTLTSQRQISFTSNLVANPTYTKNTTYIDRLVYQPSSNSYYISGMTADYPTAGGTAYYNGFVIRATVDTDYTGTILNRTYTIASLPDTITLNNASTFTGTSFGTMTTTAYTLSTTTGGMAASAVIPTKVNL